MWTSGRLSSAKNNPEVTGRYWGWRNPSDCENEVEFTVGPDLWNSEGGRDFVNICVSDEQAMDSYNQTFACDVSLPLSVARSLRDFLNSLPLD
jgi:hypothetical protein